MLYSGAYIVFFTFDNIVYFAYVLDSYHSPNYEIISSIF